MAMKDKPKSLTPKLRFPEFKDGPGWELRSLASVLDYERPEKYIVADTAYQSSGTPVLTANKSFIRGYTNETDGVFSDIPVIIFDDFTTDRKYVDFPFKVKSSAIKILKRTGDDDLKLIFELMGGIRFDPKEHKRYYISEYQHLEIPLPRGAEQRKIVACLTSVDEMLTAEGRKLEALRAHKKGLMQQLFPRERESRPRLRFPEFRDGPEWVTVPLGELFETTSGGTPDRTKREYWGGSVPWITTSLVDFNVIREAEEFITEAGLENSAAKLFPKGTVLVALYGQGKTRGKVAILDIEATTNQACAAILPIEGFDPAFTFLSLSGRYDEMRSLSNAGGQENLSQGLIRELPFHYPDDPAERKTIAACLSWLDALIAAASRKLDGLRAHKNGLMQQFFPSPEGA